VPKSRGRDSKRSTYTAPAPPRPKPSPRWVPIVGLALIGVGILLVILTYLVPGMPGGNANLFIGFGLMAGGLIALSQWR
jgi:hypothetical protein